MSAQTVDLVIRNINLCKEDSLNVAHSGTFTVACANGQVVSVKPSSSPDTRDEPEFVAVKEIDTEGRGLLIPGLCHAHIHLDKCFLLDRCVLENGDFKEALAVTAKVKAAFPSDRDDLLLRGRSLIMESVAAGVTSMRAHVELDDTVGLACLEVGLQLKEEMKGMCHVQIAAFAQDALFQETGVPNANLKWLTDASNTPGVEVVGSAPYVEPNLRAAMQNIDCMFNLACQRNLHLDFHLDYNLDPDTEPLIWDVLRELTSRIKKGEWRRTQRLCIGHATRLTLWGPEEWDLYKQTVDGGGSDAGIELPVTLVGLPQSDMYMMGRDAPFPPRSTLNVCKLAKQHGIQVAMAVNNVQNAFTPQGSVDPLMLCPLGVALFQAATDVDCYRLLEAVTLTARGAIGVEVGDEDSHPDAGSPPDHRFPSRLFPRIGQCADFVLLHENDSVQSAVCNPCYARTTIVGGTVVCKREVNIAFQSQQ